LSDAPLRLRTAPPSRTNLQAHPTSLVGDWAATGDDFEFEGTIEDGSIELYLLLEDGSKGLYWVGTFPNEALAGDKIASEADVDALSTSLFGSTDTEKEFTFTGEALEFEFGILGTVNDVVLTQS
jgi:hypothetical protein